MNYLSLVELGLFHLYYKRRYKKEDSPVYSIQIKPQGNPDESNTINSIPAPISLRLNTSNYNQILFEVSTMIIWAAILIMTLLAIICITTISKNNGMLIHLSDVVMMYHEK